MDDKELEEIRQLANTYGAKTPNTIDDLYAQANEYKDFYWNKVIDGELEILSRLDDYNIPEGWRRLNQIEEPEYFLTEANEVRIYQALGLMKEMFDALTDLVDGAHNIETDHAPVDFWEANLRAIKVMKKWREWK